MRIHYIAPSTLPSRSANSVHVVWQCEALSRLGAEVTLYAKRAMPEASELPGALRAAYGVNLDSVELATIYSASEMGNSLRIARHALSQIRHSGSGEHILSRNLYAAFVLALIYRRPLLFETHQLEIGPRKWLQGALIRCPWVTTIVISEHLARYLAEHHGVPPHRTLILPDAAPDGIQPVPPAERRARLCALVEEAHGSWKQVCGYFGHLYPGRGIEIVEGMAVACPESLFLVYGGAETDLAFRRAANRHANVAFMGYVPHPVARELMGLMDVLLMPYQERVSIGVAGHDTAGWMSPMKMFEYLGAGVPFVASDLPVLREVLRDGDNCLLVSPADVRAWIAALTRLEKQPNLASQLSFNAHVQYKQKHTWIRRGEQIIAAAKKL